MVRRLGVFCSAGAMLATALIALSTMQGVSAAHADSFQDWATASTGGAHTCGIRHGGKLYCWGWDAFDQVGDGGTNSNEVASPTRIGSFEDWATVSAGNYHTCGVRKNGKLYCWGYDGTGEVGNGDTTGRVTTPLRIGTFEDWANVSAGSYHTCGVRKNGKLYCWGSDGAGQVGNGPGDSNILAPVRVGSFEDWSTVAAGASHTCGIRHGGKLYCWGSDVTGQIGDDDGTNDNVTAPKRIGSFEDWATVSAGANHNCGVRKNGKLYCWGLDSSGQVGDGDSTSDNVTAPRRIGTFEDWAGVDAGTNHNCGVRKNGKLYCWGNDGSGQVGDGDEAGNVTSPRRIGTFEDWANDAGGASHTCAVRANGKLYCWGADLFGQLGDGPGDGTTDAPRRV
jgi:alpha-tubulin suppressor-like RCC1 family protein